MSELPVTGPEIWLQVVSAVDYLADLERPGFTVWDALEEAVRWWKAEHRKLAGTGDESKDLPWEDPDPLRSSLADLFDMVPTGGVGTTPGLGPILDAALSKWLARTAERVNDGLAFKTTRWFT